MYFSLSFLLSFDMREKALKPPSVADIVGMVLGCLYFHQPVLSVLPIQMESTPNKDRAGNQTESYAYHLRNANHVDDDRYHKYGKQTADKNEEVLSYQTLKFCRTANAFIDIKFHSS
jgi:hypothetical protein